MSSPNFKQFRFTPDIVKHDVKPEGGGGGKGPGQSSETKWELLHTKYMTQEKVSNRWETHMKSISGHLQQKANNMSWENVLGSYGDVWKTSQDINTLPEAPHKRDPQL